MVDGKEWMVVLRWDSAVELMEKENVVFNQTFDSESRMMGENVKKIVNWAERQG